MCTLQSIMWTMVMLCPPDFISVRELFKSYVHFAMSCISIIMTIIITNGHYVLFSHCTNYIKLESFLWDFIILLANESLDSWTFVQNSNLAQTNNKLYNLIRHLHVYVRAMRIYYHTDHTKKAGENFKIWKKNLRH